MLEQLVRAAIGDPPPDGTARYRILLILAILETRQKIDELSAAYARAAVSLEVAVYLDGDKALAWWHRNVARRQYGIQGWKKAKIYPDFIFAVQREGEAKRITVLETKGDQLALDRLLPPQTYLNSNWLILQNCRHVSWREMRR